MAACGSSPSVTEGGTLPPTTQGRLAALPAESGQFPGAAKTATDLLGRARVKGLGEAQMSKVSLEVVQLAIECLEPTLDCYKEVGKSLEANQLLFARIEATQQNQCKVYVGLFDVDTGEWRRQATKVYDTEEDASYALREVVEEATRP
jgi:hypothetical protein